MLAEVLQVFGVHRGAAKLVDFGGHLVTPLVIRLDEPVGEKIIAQISHLPFISPRPAYRVGVRRAVPGHSQCLRLRASAIHSTR